jgi:hypothetical protein
MSHFIRPSFSKNTPNKIGNGIDVSGKNTLIKTQRSGGYWGDGKSDRVAIADEPINAKVHGKKVFCVRVDKTGSNLRIMIGFTPMKKFDSKKEASFGTLTFFETKDFTGCGILLYNGNLLYPNWDHNIIDGEISKKAKEIIVILTISTGFFGGKKKEIRFICDGKESESTDVSDLLKGDHLFPAICLHSFNQQITTIPIDKIKTRTPEIVNLIKEYQEQQNRLLMERERNKQNEEMMYNFFKQFEQQTNTNDSVEVETKKENTKEKKVKQVATKKTKKETKTKTTKATKKKEEKKNNKEKKTKAKK